MLLNQWQVWEKIGYKPHAGQKRIASSRARMRVVSAGRRFGKSDIGGHDLTNEGIVTQNMMQRLKEASKRREFWIVGPEYSDSEKEFRVVWNELKKLEVPFDKPGSYNDPIGGNMHLSLWDGTFQLHAKSAKHPETLVGEGLSGVVMAEAAKLKERVWFKFIRPTLADFGGWALLSSTPEGKNWFYEQWQAGQDPERINWESWRMPSWMNPYVYKKPTRGPDVRLLQSLMQDPKEERTPRRLIEEMGLLIDDEILDFMEDLTPEAFNQEIGADFTEFVGRVFKEFDEEWHVGSPKWDPKMLHFGAVDYGFTNPNVWLLIQVDPFGNLYILDEVYERGLTADEFADEIMSRGLHNVSAFFPDPASPGDTATLEKKLKVRAQGGTGGELVDRINAIRASLKVRKVAAYLPHGHPDRLPRLIIHRRCKNTIHEFNEMRYPNRRDTVLGDEAPEKPMKKDDHAPEALGRFLAGYEGTAAGGGGPTRQRRAKIGAGTRREGS